MSRGRMLASLAPAAGLALLATGLVAPASPAAADPFGQRLVISEVYGGGGNSGATYTHDFVELYNPTDAPISVAGASVQYRSKTGTSPTVTPLSGTVPAKGHYLVQLAQGSGGTTPLPTPDATGTATMSGTDGVVLLVPSTAGFTAQGDLAGSTEVWDAVGYGDEPTTYETSNTGVDLSNSTSASRAATGAGTDRNADDFTRGAPSPVASGAGGGDDEEPPGPVAVPIAQVQGNGAASPLAGQDVTTSGVVIAAYPEGGLRGFVIQTPGSTPGPASHGLFVFDSRGVADVAVGDHVEVTGRVTEYQGLTEITIGSATDVVALAEPAVVAPAEVTWPETDAERERLESMLLAPQGPFTVTDNYSLNNYAEIGIAAGTEPLRQPTDVAPFGSARAEQVEDHNAAALVTLDDGASVNFLGADANKDIPLPWLTDDPTIRVGEPVQFVNPVVLDYRYDLWRFQPTGQLTAGDDAGVLPATFGDTRTATPAATGGDLTVASFNVLNYFPTTGDQLEGCSYYTDRDGDPVTIRGGCDARGAAEAEDFERQRAKIVRAINALDADVVSLEEIENSAQFLRDRDRALANLVAALNADAGAGTWAYVKSPTQTPTRQREDYIRTGFIYKPAEVKAQGQSVIYDGEEFDRARDPLAQVFKPVGGRESDKFILIVNHFKSKGSPPSSSTDPNADHGQGNWNALRVEQARALVRFADELTAETGVPKVYLDGDLNSYTFEDPMQVLYDAGYTSLGHHFGASETYLFDGLVGSLDHGLANEAAMATTTGAATWDINADESVALEYSRHNYNVTDFFDPTTPYRASDHDPVLFGVDVSKR